jgi:hypothetical protein
MKSRTSHLMAALLVSAAPLAYAQSEQPTPIQPDPLQPPAGLVSEPVASVSRDDPVAGTVAQALNAEPALKNSKITVTPDEGGVILLTGATMSEAQKLRATQIARTHAGEDKVVNTLAHDENVIWVPDPKPAAGETVASEEAAAGSAETANAPASTNSAATPNAPASTNSAAATKG